MSDVIFVVNVADPRRVRTIDLRAVAQSVTSCLLRMNFDERLRCKLGQAV